MRSHFFQRASLIAVATASLMAASFAGCLDEAPLTPLSDIYTEGTEYLDGIALVGTPMIEGAFEVDGVLQEWSDAPVLTVEAGKVQIPKRDPLDPMNQEGTRHLPFAPNANLHVRIKDGELLAGYTAGWAIRVGGESDNFCFWCYYYSADGTAPEGGEADGAAAADDQRDPSSYTNRRKGPPENPCKNLNLNGRQDAPADQVFKFKVTMPGLYVIQAEILKGTERAGMLCEPMVGIVNTHWTVEGEIQPIGYRVPWAWGMELETPNYRHMVDTITFDVGIAAYYLSSPPHHGDLIAETKYRGDWDPTKGNKIDLEIRDPFDQSYYASCGSWIPDPNVSPTEFAHKVVSQPLYNSGIWAARVGTSSVQWCFDYDRFYANPTPVPYTLDLTLTYR